MVNSMVWLEHKCPRALGGIVFGAPAELAALNSLVWPEIARLAREAAAQLHKVRSSLRDVILRLGIACHILKGITCRLGKFFPCIVLNFHTLRRGARWLCWTPRCSWRPAGRRTAMRWVRQEGCLMPW